MRHDISPPDPIWGTMSREDRCALNERRLAMESHKVAIWALFEFTESKVSLTDAHVRYLEHVLDVVDRQPRPTFPPLGPDA